jgi:succinoglycan biosynthesis protein ExoV
MILEAFSRARLVLTEAMHGAIVADALRIPWIPLAISPEMNRFKWMDWTMAMELPLHFHPLPTPSRYQRWRWQKRSAHVSVAGLDGGVRNGRPSPDDMLRQFRSRYERHHPLPDPGGPASALVKRAAASILPLFDGHLIDRTASALRAVAGQQSYLSADGVLRVKMEQLDQALHRLECSVMARAA